MSRLTPPTGERVIIPPRRKLSPKDRLQVLLNGGGRCYLCRAKIIDQWQAEHPVPFALTGDNEVAHLRPACIPCHEPKTREQDVPQIAKAKRQEKLRLDVERTVSPAWRASRGFQEARRVPAKTRRS